MRSSSALSRPFPGFSARKGFTLVELLVVVALVGILLSFVFAAGFNALKQSMRSAARSQIQNMSQALEAYKTDQGVYPQVNKEVADNSAIGVPALGGTPPYGATPATYVGASTYLYGFLSGHMNAAGTPTPATPVSAASVTGHIYMTFPASQLDITGTYLIDPFRNAWGYYSNTSTAKSYVLMNGAGQYDLWSTGGQTAATATAYAAWITNWGQGN